MEGGEKCDGNGCGREAVDDFLSCLVEGVASFRSKFASQAVISGFGGFIGAAVSSPNAGAEAADTAAARRRNGSAQGTRSAPA